MKELIIKLFHSIFGYEFYLRIFSIFKIKTLFLDSRKSEYVYFNSLINERANVVVIGACTGITTVPFALGYSNRSIFAYEPLSSNYKVLTNVIKFFGLKNINTFNLGIGNKSEQRTMILPLIHGTKKHGMAHIKDASLLEYNEGPEEQIDLETIDQRIELKNIKIDALKIVAENFEYEIFEGAKELIAKNKPIIYCELWDNEKRKKVLELLLTYHYKVFFVKNKQLYPYSKELYGGKNFILKPSHE